MGSRDGGRGAMFVTKRQKQMFDYIERHIRKAGYAPTLAEIGDQFGLTSLATVHKHLSNLEAKGLIRRKWNYSRAIELVPQPGRRQAMDLPLLGRVAAGKPIEAIEHADDTISVPEEFIRKNHTYALQVTGNSMIADGICDGDYVIVEERLVPDNGETVVAVIDGEATVKRFFRDRGGKVRLQPANETMKPIVARAKDVEIRGVVVAVMRKY
jgi:repressor LexA